MGPLIDKLELCNHGWLGSNSNNFLFNSKTLLQKPLIKPRQSNGGTIPPNRFNKQSGPTSFSSSVQRTMGWDYLEGPGPGPGMQSMNWAYIEPRQRIKLTVWARFYYFGVWKNGPTCISLQLKSDKTSCLSWWGRQRKV